MAAHSCRASPAGSWIIVRTRGRCLRGGVQRFSPTNGLTRIKIADHSFFNRPALPTTLADTIGPDFP